MFVGDLLEVCHLVMTLVPHFYYIGDLYKQLSLVSTWFHIDHLGSL